MNFYQKISFWGKLKNSLVVGHLVGNIHSEDHAGLVGPAARHVAECVASSAE